MCIVDTLLPAERKVVNNNNKLNYCTKIKSEAPLSVKGVDKIFDWWGREQAGANGWSVLVTQPIGEKKYI